MKRDLLADNIANAVSTIKAHAHLLLQIEPIFMSYLCNVELGSAVVAACLSEKP